MKQRGGRGEEERTSGWRTWSVVLMELKVLKADRLIDWSQ